MKDATATMGSVLPEDTGGRDAVHVAVVAVTAGQNMKPGDHIGLSEDKSQALLNIDPTIGIVDPFIGRAVKKGERFWLFLYPRTITSLKHQWSHPSFEEDDCVYVPPATKLSSEQWLRAFVEHEGMDYDYLIAAAADDSGGFHGAQGDDYYGFRKESGYLLSCGADAHGEIPDEFWKHVEIVTGKKIKIKPSYFSCSC